MVNKNVHCKNVSQKYHSVGLKRDFVVLDLTQATLNFTPIIVFNYWSICISRTTLYNSWWKISSIIYSSIFSNKWFYVKFAIKYTHFWYLESGFSIYLFIFSIAICAWIFSCILKAFVWYKFSRSSKGT